MFKSLAVAAALCLAVAGPAAASMVDISQTIPDNNDVPYYTTSQDFVLPAGFGTAKLHLTTFASDDSAVIQINGANIVGTGIFGPGDGYFFFTPGGPSQLFHFELGNDDNPLDLFFDAPFVEGSNNITVIVNNNYAGINTGGGGLTGGPSALYLTGAVTYDSGAVPEPAAWALMIGGFGLAGATLRRRRSATAQ
jgi:hypothetical protein